MPLAVQRIGIGLRAPHFSEFFAQRPNLALVELHCENHFAAGGPAHEIVRRAAECAPLSLHGVGLSLGSADELDPMHLKRLATLVEQTRPVLVSEHVSWGRIGAVHTHDLLPLPYCRDTLDLLVSRVDQVQQALGREILVENVSSYVQLEYSSMPEWEFVAELVERADCGLLLDVNNAYVNSHNHRLDVADYFSAMPWARVHELHVAGHLQEGELLVDTHSRPVCGAVRRCLLDAVARCSPAVSVLLEWDADLPSFDALLAHAFALAEPAEECVDAMA